MSIARTIFAITFVLFVGITLIVPGFPPAQLLYKYVGMRQTTLSISGISLATLLNGITNGLFWTIVAITAYGLAQLALHTRKSGLLPPMPIAPRLTTPPLENSLIDSRGNSILPALTIPPMPSSTVTKEPAQAMVRTEPVAIRFSGEPIGAELAIETIDGIGPVRGALFRESGIDTVSDLLRVGATDRGRHRLANEIGVTYATVLRWVYEGELLRVRGTGRK